MLVTSQSPPASCASNGAHGAHARLLEHGDEVGLVTVFEQARVGAVRAVRPDDVDLGQPPIGAHATLEAQDAGGDWLVTNTRLPA